MDGPVDGTAMKWQNGDRKKLMDKKTNIEKEASKATPRRDLGLFRRQCLGGRGKGKQRPTVGHPETTDSLARLRTADDQCHMTAFEH
jgi:hypothetical protein